jgi:hypothetical protein
MPAAATRPRRTGDHIDEALARELVIDLTPRTDTSNTVKS